MIWSRARRSAHYFILLALILGFLLLPPPSEIKLPARPTQWTELNPFGGARKQKESRHHSYLFGDPSAPEGLGKPSPGYNELDCLPETLREGPFLRDINNPGNVVAAPHRLADVTDAFEYYKKSDTCTLSSLELHDPFEPLCKDKESLLAAMSGGGRGGRDMPYMPRGCDMRWFTTVEVCDILSRYSRIWIIGDSLMRHTTSALHLFLRQDLINGARASWRPDPEEYPCDCDNPFNSGGCLFHEAWSTGLIMQYEPWSISCPQPEIAPIEYDVQPEYPLLEMVPSLTERLPKTKPEKPQAFIYGHGLWNDLNETITMMWVEQVEAAINQTNPWLTERGAVYPRLFITPSASGPGKPQLFVASQGNPALRRFEANIGEMVAQQGIDHLGTLNMTIQSTSPDGTHAGMRQDLIKAQMVLNWLNMYDTSGY